MNAVERISEAAAQAQNNLDKALAQLNEARAAYDQQAGPQYSKAKADLATLDAKIEAALDAQEEANAAFHREFSAAGFEKTPAVAEALRRKGDAQAMAESMMAGRDNLASNMPEIQIEASHLARDYVVSYGVAQNAYAQAQAYEALQSAGATIARAMALLSHVPGEPTGMEDFLGRPPHSARAHDELHRARMGSIWADLCALAYACPEFNARPKFDGLGELDLGALRAQDILSPAQIHNLRSASGLPSA